MFGFKTVSLRKVLTMSEIWPSPEKDICRDPQTSVLVDALPGLQDWF